MYLLAEARGADANVFFHVVRRPGLVDWGRLRSVVDNWLLLAADLAEHRKPREEARALEIVRQSAKGIQP
jgi:hypothetical protein